MKFLLRGDRSKPFTHFPLSLARRQVRRLRRVERARSEKCTWAANTRKGDAWLDQQEALAAPCPMDYDKSHGYGKFGKSPRNTSLDWR